MLQTVVTGLLCLAGYELHAGTKAVDQLRNLARPLRGCQVLHLNAKPRGGGVTEILRSEVPLPSGPGHRSALENHFGLVRIVGTFAVIFCTEDLLARPEQGLVA